MTSRAEIMQRARTGWRPGTVVYSQAGTNSPTGHRPDCSGYMSMCLGLPAPGLSTVTLATTGTLVEISPADLQPGDVVGACGPGTAGDGGHVIIFDCWLNSDPADNRYWGWEQRGGGKGPTRRVIRYPDDNYPGTWRAWKYTGITDKDQSMAGETSDFVASHVTNPKTGTLCGEHVAVGEIWAAVIDLQAQIAKIGAALQNVTAVARPQVAGVSAHDVAAELITQLKQ
jgi:hypothetical protein